MDERRGKIRGRELMLVVVAGLFFGVAIALLLPGAWPLMPFPQPAPVEITAALGLAFGLLFRRAWTMALPLTVLVALDPPRTGIAGSVVALLVVWPFAAAGAAAGVGAVRGMRRWLLHHALRRARVAKHAQSPAKAAAAVRASRRKRTAVADTGR